MQDSESTEDIYNNLPVDLFTNDYDEFETDSLGSDLDNYTSESLNETISPDCPLQGSPNINDSVNSSTEDDAENVLESFKKLNLEFKVENIVKRDTVPSKISTPVEEESSSIWIRCVRCGKKNEIDCNFCGKCGLQIHKSISIVEPEAEESLSPEVSRNIKYHYKRPVFCFGHRGNCFASFSSPSKSVRNVSKFQLSSLKEFHEDLDNLKKSKVVASNCPVIWGEKELKDSNWLQKDSILKDITIMIASKSSFILDDLLRSNLREYFASISPKDLGSIKMLATQDSVSYLRGEIDEIFHLLVIGKTMEACELCIKFNYWDHALIIAKTLDTSFYETVMNRFLDSRFANGHPLRILYLIMTNNENSALEEIRNMINNREMPLFVQEIWTILINFLLRARHESLVIARIFEDIARCLFDRNLFENALICYIISVLSGSKVINPDVLEKIDYLLAWFLQCKPVDTINFSALPILNVFVDKMSSLNSKSIMWRCQFLRLMNVQFLHDLGCFDKGSLNYLSSTLNYSKVQSESGYLSLFVEETSILEVRNLTQIEEQRSSPILPKNNVEQYSKVSTPTAQNYSFDYAPPNLLMETVPTAGFEPVQPKLENNFANPEHVEPTKQFSESYSPVVNDDFISTSKPLSPNHPNNNSLSSEGMANESKPSSLASNKTPPAGDKNESGGSAFIDKLKNWLPVKSNPNQDNQKQITKAKMGKPNSFRYDEKLKKWVDDNDPSTLEETPKLPPPPIAAGGNSPAGLSMPNPTITLSFRAKKGKVKYFDPLNPEGPSSSQLQPSVPNFD